jgi:hypothetical protein
MAATIRRATRTATIASKGNGTVRDYDRSRKRRGIISPSKDVPLLFIELPKALFSEGFVLSGHIWVHVYLSSMGGKLSWTKRGYGHDRGRRRVGFYRRLPWKPTEERERM